MNEHTPPKPPDLDEPEPDTPPPSESGPAGGARVLDEPPHPVNWNLLTAKQAAIVPHPYIVCSYGFKKREYF